VDTLALPSIAYREWTNPVGTPLQAAARAAGEDKSNLKPSSYEVFAPMERIANLVSPE
jgi:hypothetical protein